MTSKNLITLVESKNKFLVPQFSGKPIHSLINPQKEAESLANNYMSQLTKNPHAIILGLGFGYHVDEIFKLMKLKHQNFTIQVIEGSSELVKIFQSYKGFSSEKISIISTEKPQDLFYKSELINTLLMKPTIIIHPGSYNTQSEYYKLFLTRRALTQQDPSLYQKSLTDVLAKFDLPSKAGQKLAHAIMGI